MFVCLHVWWIYVYCLTDKQTFWYNRQLIWTRVSLLSRSTYIPLDNRYKLHHSTHTHTHTHTHIVVGKETPTSPPPHTHTHTQPYVLLSDYYLSWACLFMWSSMIISPPFYIQKYALSLCMMAILNYKWN